MHAQVLRRGRERERYGPRLLTGARCGRLAAIVWGTWIMTQTALGGVAGSDEAKAWPPLPAADGKVEIPAQPVKPGEARTIGIHIRYPGRALANVKPSTGLMLCLHNWGGSVFANAPQPEQFADKLDLVGIGVDYYQTGDADHSVPYDYGYLQTMDVLRALYYVYRRLEIQGIRFDRTRLYSTGGSGGGNVSEMANKLAPRTLACIIDLSGMASLSPAAGNVVREARYSDDPASPAYPTPDMREIRDIGNAAHLALMKKWGNECRVIVIHGEDDQSCFAADKKRAVAAMQAAGRDVEPHFISKAEVDGALIGNSAHQIGDRTKLLLHFAGPSLTPGSDGLRRLKGRNDFERRETLRYPTTNGAYAVSFARGYPEIAFEARGLEP